jgi:hypothetical protein
VTGGRADGGIGDQGDRSGLSAAARTRLSGEDFATSFARLRHVIDRSCARHSRWQAQIAGGIQATLDFAVACPASARALTIQARGDDRDGAQSEEAVLAYFTERLAKVTPAQEVMPIRTEAAIVESIATIVRGHLRRDSTDELSDVAPDLIYLALVPYAGVEQARHWTELFLPVSALYGT